MTAQYRALGGPQSDLVAKGTYVWYEVMSDALTGVFRELRSCAVFSNKPASKED